MKTRRPWPVRKEHSDHMRKRRRQNLSSALKNPNENAMADLLATTGYVWSRQATWGFRVFDFWCHKLGCAVEVDGIQHDSGIVVLRAWNNNATDFERECGLVASR
jgi:very-short-patch-repair endonuclease